MPRLAHQRLYEGTDRSPRGVWDAFGNRKYGLEADCSDQVSTQSSSHDDGMDDGATAEHDEPPLQHVTAQSIDQINIDASSSTREAPSAKAASRVEDKKQCALDTLKTRVLKIGKDRFRDTSVSLTRCWPLATPTTC